MPRNVSKSASGLGEALGELLLEVQETPQEERATIAAETMSGFMSGFGDYSGKIKWGSIKWSKLLSGLGKIFTGIGEVIAAFAPD